MKRSIITLVVTTALALSGALLAGGPTRAAAATRAAPAPPQRIVSLVPAATEMLFAMGAGNRVAGVSSYDRYPPEATRLPKLGGLFDPDVERLLALHPDLAVIYGTQVELRKQLERAGVPYFACVHRGLPDILSTIRELGARVGAATRAAELSKQIDSQLAEIRAKVAGKPRPKTLLVIDREPRSLRQVYASGGYGFLHDMLEVAGGSDVLSDIRRESVQMSSEMILARAPEVIVELHYGAELSADQLDAERHVWDQLSAVPAVKNHRVHLLVGDEFVVPGPRVGTATTRLAEVLHP
jgi:iron complex transport system substrate-binding protein